jgi:hypothetical protein
MVDVAADDDWLAGRVEKVDKPDWRTDDVFWVLVVVADGTGGDDEA